MLCNVGLVSRTAKDTKFEDGQTVLKQGEPGGGFYLILEGGVEVKVNGKSIRKLGPGQFFGEMSIFDNSPRSADIVTVEPSRILFL